MTPGWRQLHFGIFMLNFVRISHIVLLFLLLTFNQWMSVEINFRFSFIAFILDFEQVVRHSEANNKPS